MSIEWADIQGNILRGYLFPRARFTFVAITEASGGLRWLRDAVTPLVEAPPPGWRQPPRFAVNVALSHAGLAALDTDPAVLAAFPPEYREGMWARATGLGDLDWERGWCNQPSRDPRDRERLAVGGGEAPPAVHVLVSAYAHEAVDLDELDALVRPAADDAGARVIGTTDVEVLEATADGRHDGRARDRREHFGFADGLSQPRIAGVNAPPGGPAVPWWQWWRRSRPVPNPVIQPGEFVLGYPDEDSPVPLLPEPSALFRNGSYLVYRKLAQDVGAFRAFVARGAGLAREAGYATAGEVDIAASVMGRDHSGAALVGCPAGGDPARDFSYRDDPEGQACPLGAHIRRANPRDGHALGASAVNRHRLLRRGLPYGPPYAEGPDPDGDDGGRDRAERGIIFLVYGASISRQFEFVQRSWLNDGDAVGIGHTGDVVSGAPDVEATIVLPGGGRLRRERPFVIPQGGEYLFAPGIEALQRLALGQLRTPDSRLTTALARYGRTGAALVPNWRHVEVSETSTCPNFGSGQPFT